MAPKVSIIVPCRNEVKTIHLLLEALLEQDYPLEKTEVIIADGQSDDGTPEAIAAFQAQHPKLALKLVENKKRVIPSGLNRAIEAASGEFILRLDAHSVPQRDYVSRSIAALEAGIAENVGGVWDIRPQNNSWQARSIAEAAASPIGVGDAQYRYGQKAGYVDTVPFGAYQRLIIDQIGAYDETLLSNEDYEFNTRIRQAGGRIWMDPAIQCVYFARPSLRSLAKQYWRYGFWKVQMLKRYPKTLRWRQALPPLFVLGILVLLLAGLFLRPAWTLLGIVLGLYLLILLAAGLFTTLKKKDILFTMGIPLAIITMHFSWGSGFLFGLFKNPR
jgi:succinoglycan biosynthesis protein ExoA